MTSPSAAIGSTSDSSSLKNYTFEEEIGHGSFATVYRALHKESGATVAIKAVHRHKLNRKLFENLSLEISILQKIRHPHIIRLHEIHQSEKFIYLVMEYCEGSDLASLIKHVYKSKKASSAPNLHQLPSTASVNAPTQYPSRLSEAMVQKFVLQLASALECLRANHLVHRDLKPQNLLLTSNDIHTASLKIADFGFARYVSTSDLADTLCGSPLYMAPEILRYEKYDAKADLWSVGAIMYEMLLGRPPFRAQNHIQLLKKIESTELDTILPKSLTQSHGLSGQCLHLLRSLLRKDPLERIGFEEFFMHPFLRLLDLSAMSSLSVASSSTGSLAVLKSVAISPLLAPTHPPLHSQHLSLASGQLSTTPSSYIPIPSKSGRIGIGPHVRSKAGTGGGPSTLAATFAAPSMLTTSAKAAFSLTGIGMRRHAMSGSLSSDNQSLSSSSYRTSHWMHHTSSSREPSLSPPSKSDSVEDRKQPPSFSSSRDSSIAFDLSSPTFAAQPSNSSIKSRSVTFSASTMAAAPQVQKNASLDLTPPNMNSFSKISNKQQPLSPFAASSSQSQISLSSSTPKTWSYVSDQAHRRPSGPFGVLYPLNTPTDKVVALGESFDKDFVIIEKSPATTLSLSSAAATAAAGAMTATTPTALTPTSATLGTPTSLSEPKLSPSSHIGEYSQSFESSWPFAHLMRRISIPIPGYTVPKDHSMGHRRKSSDSPSETTSAASTAVSAPEPVEKPISKSYSAMIEHHPIEETMEKLTKSSQDDIRYHHNHKPTR